MSRVRLLSALYVPTMLVLGGVVAINLWGGVPIAHLMRDPMVAVHTDVPFYAGLISNAGVILWAVPAVICIFAALLLRARGDTDGWSPFLMASGALTSWLLIDDMFMLHDQALRDYIHVPEKLTFLAYAMVVCVYLAVFSPRIRRTDVTLFVLAFCFFGISLGMDVLVHDEIYLHIVAPDFKARHLFEDGAKLLGIVTWCAYLVRTSWRALVGKHIS